MRMIERAINILHSQVYGHFETLPLRDWILRDYCQFLVLDTSRLMSGHFETIDFGHFETVLVSK